MIEPVGKTKNRLVAAMVIAAVVGVLGYLAFGSIGNNLVYYWSPSELAAAGAKAQGATVRLGGLVQAGSVRPDGTATIFTVVAEDMATTVQVRSEAIPPAMFREGIGVVVEGSLGPDGVFQSKKLMVKHDENYQRPTDEQSMEATMKGAKE